MPARSDVQALERDVEALYDRIGELATGDREAGARVEAAIELLDRGEARVAEVGADDEVVVHEWLKKAILLLFKLRDLETIELGPFEYADRLPLKRNFAAAGVRVVPGGSARWGSYLAPGVVLMPSYVNIGAYVGEQTMVDTWATVASCAQIGARVHLSGGVGIGGVLEPPNAVPVVVEDDAFIGSRCMVTGGARVGRGAVLGAGSFLDPSIPVYRRAERGGDQPGRGPALVRRHPGQPAARVPGWRVLRPVRARHQATERGRAAQQGPAQRDPPPARREHVTPDLIHKTAELVAIPSVSRNETAIADHVERALRGCSWLAVERVGDNVIARTDLGRAERVAIAGHLDTVPPADNTEPRVVGETLFGLGSCDMKGGVAIMLELATTVVEPAYDMTWCFYRGEEIDRSENGLVQLFSERPELLAADAAILCEPTGSLVEAGCQGSVRARIVLGGKRAHTARAHLGRNAIHRAAPVIARAAAWEPRTVVIDGCEYTERLSVVGVSGGVAANVVPDRVEIALNFRFAPDRDSDGAMAYLSGLFADLIAAAEGDAYEVLDVGPCAHPRLSHPVLAKLLAATGQPPRAKLGWTDVATFSANGIPATNFGPGNPELAHQADEHVTRESLDAAWSNLAALIGA